MKNLTLQANLPVTILREDEQFVAYTPALDLSTSGATLEQSQSRLAEAVAVFFEECHNRGTLEAVLADLGWSKHHNQLTPPVVVGQNLQTFKVPAFV